MSVTKSVNFTTSENVPREVGEGLTHLGFKALGKLSGFRHKTDLTGAEDDVSGFDRLVVRADRSRGRLG